MIDGAEDTQPEDDSLDPAVIPAIGPTLINDDYTTAISKLKDLYSTSNWSDKEVAAQNFAELAQSLNEMHGVDPEVSLTSDAISLSRRLLDKNLPEESKLKAIEDWRTSTKQGIYNTDDAESLIAGKAKEALTDQYASELRRGVVAGDVGTMTDLVARGAEAAISPLIGTADTLLGTNLHESFREKVSGYENPKNDDSTLAMIASGVGSVAGFALAETNPVTAWGYLGAVMVSQGKDVYDNTLKISGSEEAAKSALLESSPGILLGAVAGKLVGGTLGQTLQGQKGYVGALTGAVSGALGAGGQSLITEEALYNATGKEELKPDLSRVGTQTAIGGILGLGVGAYHDLKSEISIKRANKEIQKTLGLETVPTEPNRSSAIGAFVKTQANKPNPTATDIEGEPLEFKEQDPLQGPIRIKPEGKPPPDATAEFLTDTQQANKIDKVLSIAPEWYTPQPYMLELIRQMDGKYSLQDLQSAFGFYDPSTNSIVIRRSIFKDLPQAYRTFAHEIGHMIDYYGRTPEVQEQLKTTGMHEEPVLMKLVRMNKALQGQFDEGVVGVQAKLLSSEWRAGWEGAPPVPEEWIKNPPAETSRDYEKYSYLQYRNRTTEIQADTISALLNSPKHVKETYPEVWRAFEQGLETHPPVKQFWEEVVAINQDPTKYQEWFQKQREEGRITEAKIVQMSAEDNLERLRLEREQGPKKALEFLRRTVINRFGVARDIVGKVTGGKEKEAAAYNELMSHLTGHQKIFAQIDTPNKILQEQYLALGLPKSGKDPFSLWKNYEYYNHIINDTTVTMENIRANPALYRRAFQDLHNFLEVNYAKMGLRRNPLSQVDIKDVVNENLVDSFAKLHSILPPEIMSGIQTMMLDRNNLPAAELMDAGAFRARRYLANPEADIRTAVQGIALMKQQLGEENFKALQNVSQKFHDINGNYLFKTLEDSGLFDDKLMQRLKLNKNSYITFNVLKYFKEDPRFKGTIQAQYGTLDTTGDELASTLQKTKVLGMVAEYQKANNAAVELARLGGYKIQDATTVKGEDGELLYKKPPGKSLFGWREDLQRLNPEKSFLIEFDKGTPTLYEINSPDFGKMFAPSSLDKNPMMSEAFRLIEGYNKIFLERELKTVLSVPFIFRQKIIDRATEAILARSKELPGLWFHTSKPLRTISKEALQSANLFRKGIFTKDVQEMLDLNALVYHNAQAFSGHDDPSLKAENAIYEKMGVHIPGEEKLNTPIRINQKLNKILTESWLGKHTLGKVREIAERDEARTKIASYLIAKRIRGLSPAEAAIVAREYAGTPDPFGGGSESTPLNKLFLFGRAHINGMRGLYNQFKEDPRGFGIQYAYRKGIPRILVSSALMGPLIGALFGDNEEQLYRKFLDKIPGFDKLSKLIVPFGFIDDKGNYRGMNVDPKEIGANWKASYLRLPVARELVSIDTLMGVPLKAIEEYADTGVISLKHIAQNTVQAIGSVVGGNVAPAIAGTVRTGMLAGGYNPYDMYRNKGILTRDVAEAGTVMEKAYQYFIWSAYQTAPGVFSYNLYQQNSTDSLDPLDYAAKIPFLGSTAKAFIGESNYGDYELSKVDEARKKEFDASIRLKLGPESKKLYNEYSKAQSLVSRLGKNWRQEVSQEQANMIHALNNWHARAYRHAFNEMRAAFEKGDAEDLETSANDLESASSSYSTMLDRP